MEPSKEAINVRLCRLNTRLWKQGAVSTNTKSCDKHLTREALLDALTVLYDECNKDSLKKNDNNIANFIETYRSSIYELKQLRVNITDFEIKDLIGRGYFGEVHVVQEKHTGDVYAMKTLRKETTLKHVNLAYYEEERDIMTLAHSDWIIKLHYAFQDSTQLYLVMEYCPGGDLAGLLDRMGKPLVEKYAAFYLAEIILALKHIHSLGFVHRDVKPDNVLLDRLGHLKLADFGSAACLSSLGKVKTLIPIGTTEYISPELLISSESSGNNMLHGIPCDYWSLGIVAYELVTCSTPFKAHDGKSILQTFKKIIEHSKTTQNIVINYPAEVSNSISDEYKELVRDLLHPVPENRPTHLSLNKYKVFENIKWDSLKEQVPPFVPIVNGQDDASNFIYVEKQSPVLDNSVMNNFRTKAEFSGKNLPFIGFTYNQDLSMDLPNDSKEKNINSKDISGNNSSDSSGSVNGYFASNMNGTAICLSNIREMENLLESRKKEIESLHKQLAQLPMKQFSEDKEKRLIEAENMRSKLEKDIADMLCQNQKLQQQLELEHRGREILENKSLQLIRTAKQKWKERTEEQITILCKKINGFQIKETETNERIKVLENKLLEKTSDLSKTIKELDSLKKLQLNHKDHLAKARRLSCQSIIGIEQFQDSNKQFQTLNEKLRKEIDLKDKLDIELKQTLKNLQLVEERENNLINMFRIEKDSFTKEFMTLSDKYDQKCCESVELRCKINEFEKSDIKLKKLKEQLLMKENLECENKNLCVRVASLETDIKHLKESELSLNLICKQKEEMYNNLMKEKDNLEAAINKANMCEEKHKQRVTALEDMLCKLQDEVTVLENARCNSTIQSSELLFVDSDKKEMDKEKLSSMEEEIKKLQEQLEVSTEQIVAFKREVRKADLALWRKEKELSNHDLDLRIATKDLKKAEEKIASLENDLKSNVADLETKVAALQQSLNEKTIEIQNLNEENKSINSDIQVHKSNLDKINSELETEKNKYGVLQQVSSTQIQSLKEKILALESDIEIIQREKSKAENLIEDTRKEYKDIVTAKCTEKEQRIRFEVMLHERTREYENLSQNYKMLQETCTLLEEQLVDFENVTEALNTNNSQLKNEITTLKSEVQTLNAEISKVQKLLDVQKLNTQSAELKNKDYIKKLEEEKNKCSEMESQIRNILLHESSLSNDVKEKIGDIAQLDTKLKQKMTDLYSKEAEIVSLKEECTRILTECADLREDNMHIKLELKESRENISTLRTMIKEQEEEMSARQFDWHQRELKAESTISQQIKLIDFLQMKVDEASKKKKTFGDMLFGKSTKENIVPPLTPQTPRSGRTPSVCDQSKEIYKEKQKNKELQEELTTLRKKIKSYEEMNDKNEPCMTRGKPEDEIIIQSLVKIQRGALLIRVCIKLYSDRIEWKADKDLQESALLFKKGHTTLVSSLQPSDYDLHLSDNEKKCAFKLNVDSQSLLIVCTSIHQKETWISKIQNLKIIDNEEATNSWIDFNKPKPLLRFSKNIEPNCILEIEKDLFFIGTNCGLYTYSTANKKNEPIIIRGVKGIIRAQICAHIDQIIILQVSGQLVHYSFRQLTAILKSVALSSLQPGTVPDFHAINLTYDIKASQEDKNCRMFEISQSKHSSNKTLLCASTATKLVIFEYNLSNMSFKNLYLLKSDNIVCMKFTPHTVIVASHKFYEIDLQNYKVEEFVDASDVSLSHAVYANKKNIFPVAIVQTKDPSVDKCYEYLLCYSAFGIFVDEFGQRTRSEDIKWSHHPFQVVYRKPFVFVISSSFAEIIYLRDDSYEKRFEPNCNSDTASLSSSYQMPEKLTLNINSLRYLGKSMLNSSIYVMSSIQKSDNMVEILELNGTLLFKNHAGRSVETLDTVDDIDSIRSLKGSCNSLLPDTDSILSEDSSVEIKTDFAAHIREKARIINSMKRENNKEHKINALISSQRSKSNVESDSSGDESDLSSSFNENNCASQSSRKNVPQTPSSSRDRTTSDIVNEMFVNKKQVRFN